MIDREAIERYLAEQAVLPESVLAAMVVGSMARGWANAYSDLDLLAICTELPAEVSARQPVPLQPPCFAVRAWHGPDQRWEVKYWTAGQVEQILAKVSWDAFESNGSAPQSLTEAEELLLERSLTGLPVVGEDWLAELRGRLADSAFQTQVTSRSLARAEESVVDALGQVEADDPHSAVLSARKAYGHAVDAMLESHGVYGSMQLKWRARRVQDAALAELPFADYWQLESMAGYDDGQPATWVADTVRRTRALIMQVEL